MDTEPGTQTTPAEIEVLNLTFMALIAASAISHLARLGIPDLVDGEPKTAVELARETGTDADALYRLMRASAAAGVLSEAPDGKFHQTRLSAVLRSNAVPSMRAMAIMTTEEWQLRGCERLDHCVRTGKTAFEVVYGKPVFEYLQGNPKAAAVFNEAMTNLSMMESPAVAEAYDFSNLNSLTDVGGGHGLLLATILRRNPNLSGTLYDQPSVIESAKSGPLGAFEGRVSFLSGDIFISVPPGADAYIMKYIIHDWPDEECFKILRACRAGMNPGGKLLIVDTVLKPAGELDWGRVLDLEMMMFPGGRERTEEQFRTLLSAAGWRLNRVIPTKSALSIVEAVPAAPE